MKYLISLLLLLSSPLQAANIKHMLNSSAIVHVRIPNGARKPGMGGCSATFISEDTVLTAGHCFSHGYDRIWVKDYEGITKEAVLVNRDIGRDLALVYVKHTHGHEYVDIGPDAVVGQDVWNVGSPFDIRFLLSKGIVSGTQRHPKEFVSSYIITDAMINPGSSGGGVFNAKGQLIGVNTMMPGGLFGWIGMSLAVDTQSIREFLK